MPVASSSAAALLALMRSIVCAWLVASSSLERLPASPAEPYRHGRRSWQSLDATAPAGGYLSSGATVRQRDQISLQRNGLLGRRPGRSALHRARRAAVRLHQTNIRSTRCSDRPHGDLL